MEINSSAVRHQPHLCWSCKLKPLPWPRPAARNLLVLVWWRTRPRLTPLLCVPRLLKLCVWARSPTANSAPC